MWNGPNSKNTSTAVRSNSNHAAAPTAHVSARARLHPMSGATRRSQDAGASGRTGTRPAPPAPARGA
jgi:hypothetical protein